MFDIYTIIFLALAVFIFLRLRSVLGQRTGRERPPYDPFSARDAVRNAPSEKVVALPRARPRRAWPNRPSRVNRPIAGRTSARPGTPVADGLQAIVAQDKSFDPQHFLTGARAAYEMIVTAFADGDRRALKNLLSKEVYDGFEAPSASARRGNIGRRRGSYPSTPARSSEPNSAPRPPRSRCASCLSSSR